MSEIRRRTATTHWSNEAPITDLHEGLDAIRGPKTYLYTGHDLADKTRPEIRQDWSDDNGSGGHRNPKIAYLDIDPELAQQLIAEELVTPMQTSDLGFTKTLKDRLVLSPVGREKRENLHEEKRALAESILKSKADSRSSTTFYDAGYGHDYGRWGRIFFGFKTPMNEEWRVYPNSGEVKKFDRHGREIKQPEKPKVLLDATEDDN